MSEITNKNSVFVLCSSLENHGGWVLDTQFIVNMGLPYLLAHGLGNPVNDACGKVKFPQSGSYRVWVYTKNWSAYWKPEYAPGKFQVICGDYCREFGDGEPDWHWQDGGVINIDSSEQKIILRDLTGFEGRCGAILFTLDNDFVPPIDPDEINMLRKKLCGYNEAKEYEYDFVVVGAGITGMCAAIEAANRGLKTALVNDRFVAGGNNSSEIRVWLTGDTKFDEFPAIGRLTDKFEQKVRDISGTANKPENYEDGKKMEILKSTENLSLYFGEYLVASDTADGVIKSIELMNVISGEPTVLKSELFCDCTGDGTLGYMSGAEYEMTAEGHMEQSNFWYVEDTGAPSEFPSCPWAIDLKEANFPHRLRGSKDEKLIKNAERNLGCWFWGSGFEHDPIKKAEYSRDVNFRAMYGAWDAIKNTDGDLPNHRIGFCSYITGKRESRRLLGDVILNESDARLGRRFPDGLIGVNITFDVHVINNAYYGAYHEGDAFITKCWWHNDFPNPFFIPYRCLYSKNVKNMFMAGRCLSVTHEGLGMFRLMRTCGLMGEVVGRAAALANKYGTQPRGVYESYLDELISLCK
ncbi:MAG: FAD-dependent oxidoreductase [Clostridia bacterium]|nr:FAD-dependent oxidoreductase [Clostridia bacterium]